MAISLILYQNNAESNVVNKTPYLTTIVSTIGTLREPTNILSPIVTIESATTPTVNYAYISALGRYYFITDMVSVRNGLWALYLNVDVLQTYSQDILTCSAVVSRNQFRCSPLVSDSLRECTLEYDIDTTYYSNDVFVNAAGKDTSYGSYVINTVGGKGVGV